MSLLLLLEPAAAPPAGGPLALAGTATRYENASGTSVVLPVPTGAAAGELLIAAVSHSQIADIPTIAGWTAISAVVSGSGAGSQSTRGFYRIATASEPASYTWATSATAGRVTGIMARVAGADTTTPLDAAAATVGTATATSATIPAVTTVTAGTLLISGMTVNAASAATLVPPASMTVLPTSPATTNTGRRTDMATEAVAATGSTGTRTWAENPTTTTLQFAGWMVALRPAPTSAVPTPALSSRVGGIATGGVGRVAVRTTDATSVRLKVGTDTAVTAGVIYGPAATPDADGAAQLTVTGLAAGTRYHYRVAMTDAAAVEALDTSITVGTFRTAPTGAADFAFCFGSCTNGADSAAMTAVAARGDDFFVHLGDMWYADGSSTGIANYKAQMVAKLAAPNHQAVFSTAALVYTPSDHDMGMNNNATGVTVPTGAANWNTTYRQLVPSPAIPATGVYFTFTWGRVRFINMDTRTFKSDPAATDDATKTALGSTQKQWLKDTITAATEPAIVLHSDAPWIGAAVAGDDGWLGYTTERAELAAFFAASGKRIVLIAGDMHALGADDGSNSPGAIPVFQASPLNNTASLKGGPYSAGTYPTVAGATVQQYGRCVVTDDGTTVTLAYTGYSSDDTARITQTVTGPLAGAPSGTATLSGGGTLTAGGVPTAGGSAALAGAGTLTAAGTPAPARAATLTGAGALTTTGAVAVTATAALTGTGTLTAAGVARPAATGALSGAGTLTATGTAAQGGTGTATLTGTGSLTATGTPAPATTTALTGGGTLTAAGAPAPTRAATLTGAGTLTAAPTPTTGGTAALTGTGALGAAGTPAPTRAAALTGSGTLTTGGTVTATTTANLTGAGTLAATGGGSQPGAGSAALTGAGTLTTTRTITAAGTASLAGTGTVTAGGTPRPAGTANLTGAGQLAATYTAGYTGAAALAGAGTLTAAAAPKTAGVATLTGGGQLTTTPVAGAEGIATLTGDGTLTATGRGGAAGPQRDLDLTVTGPRGSPVAVTAPRGSPVLVRGPTARHLTVTGPWSDHASSP